MDARLLIYPEIVAIEQPARKLIVLIHGLGSDGHDLISLVPFMQKYLPEYHFMSPHGIEPFDMAPYGRQWFSLSDRDPNKIISLVRTNIPILFEIIRRKQQELNLNNEDTILIGFSQGSMAALYLTLIQNRPFKCMVGFAGRLIPPPNCVNTQTPICLVHGEEDEVVSVKELENTIKYFKQYDIKYNALKLPNLNHSIDNRGIDFAIKFIKNLGTKQ